MGSAVPWQHQYKPFANNKMGIKFYCQDCGKKLNVKAFLAGKKGICPKCGGKVHIPTDKKVSSGAAPDENAAGAENAAQLATATSVAAVSIPITPSIPVTASHPVVASVSSTGPLAPTQPGTVPVAAPIISTAGSAVTVDGVPPSIGPSAIPQAAAVPAAQIDPIDEAPHATWYVRPGSGGQFGPAAGDIMRKWIGEGRVSAESMVWREGWTDWKLAGPLFHHQLADEANLAPGAGMPPVPSSAAACVAAGAGSPVVDVRSQRKNSPDGYRSSRRKSSKGAMTAIVILLVAVVLILLPVLILVAFR